MYNILIQFRQILKNRSVLKKWIQPKEATVLLTSIYCKMEGKLIVLSDYSYSDFRLIV